jgi:NADPH:quinone reductase
VRVRVPKLPYASMLGKNPQIRQVLVCTMPDAAKRQAIADITRWVREAVPQFAIAARFPQAQAVQAHQAVECGDKIGQVVVELP